MKRHRSSNIIVVLFLLLFINNCQNKDIDMAKFAIEEERVRPGTDTVGIEGTYDFAREARSMKIHMGLDSTLSDASSQAVTLLGKDYSVTVRGLQPGTTYYYRYSADFGMHSDLVSETRHFVTSEQPSYRISVSSDPGWGGEVTGGGNYEEGQTCTVSASPSEGYVFAFWKESEIPVTEEPSYTFEVTESRILVARFAEIAALPVVITGEVSEIGGVSAMGSGEVTGEGGSEVTERGVCWATGHVPTTSDSHAGNGSGTGAFMAEMTGLSLGTTYRVRAYAVNSEGTAYGEEKSFTTLDHQEYTVSVSASPSSGGTVEGGGSYEEGVSCTVRATATNGYTFSNWTEDGNPVSTQANYTFTVTSNRTLMANFTQQITVPTVTTTPVTNITETSATGGGNVTSDGGATVTERGICWGTSHNPTTGGSHGTSGSGLGSYTCPMTNLTPNTTYYVRAYATNSQGTAYGNEVSFVTTELPMYTINVSTNPPNAGSVNGGGSYQQGQSCSVTATASNGYDFVNWTENGNQVSTNESYTFTVTANRNLVANFTQQVTLPTVTTVTNITETAATGGGNVTSDGGATVTERGICWSTSHNPTTGGSHGSSGSGLGDYTCMMTNLTPNTTYYVRAYAANSQGTAYGNEVSFTTAQLPTYTITVSANPTNGGSVSGGGTYQQGQSCTVTATASSGYDFVNWTENGSQVSTNASYTFTVTTETAATGGGNVTSDGGATVTERGICWGTSHNPTTSGSHVTSGSGLGSYTCLMTNLTPNTTYYVRAYATNSQGTAYGNEVNFTTVQLPTYTINVSSSPTVGGSVSGGGTYQQGQSCTVTATANNGYDFLNWTENGSPVSLNANFTFTVTGNRTLVAHFEQQAPQNYTITVSANPADGGTVSGGGTYQQGQSCTVTAEANRSSSFYVDFDDSQMPAGWTTIDNGSPPGCGWQIGSTKLGSTGNGHNGSTDLILSESYDNNYGVVNPDNYLISPAVTLGNGSIFSFWACAQDASYSAEHFGVAISTTGTNASDFTMINEWTMTAKGFNGPKSGYRGNRAQGTWYQYTVDLSAYTGEGRYIAIRHFNCMDQFYLDVDDIELTGVNGYNFVNWTENGNVVSTDASYTFTVNSNRNLVANFTQRALQSCSINVFANPSNGGSVSGGGTYPQGQPCSVREGKKNVTSSTSSCASSSIKQ